MRAPCTFRLVWFGIAFSSGKSLRMSIVLKYFSEGVVVKFTAQHHPFRGEFLLRGGLDSLLHHRAVGHYFVVFFEVCRSLWFLLRHIRVFRQLRFCRAWPKRQHLTALLFAGACSTL